MVPDRQNCSKNIPRNYLLANPPLSRLRNKPIEYAGYDCVKIAVTRCSQPGWGMLRVLTGCYVKGKRIAVNVINWLVATSRSRDHCHTYKHVVIYGT